MTHTKPTIIHEPAQPFEQTIDLPGGRTRWKTLLSADRTPTNAMTVGMTEIEPGHAHEIFLHQHAQPEVYYILAGHGTVQISGEEHALQPGSLVFIPGHAPHGLCNTGDEVLRLLYVFAVDSLDQVVYKLPE
ncbi:MAG: cupin domain-containing protein [Anaerolineales bacterium]|nr:cupin domain-containing protein [Anaerolineales bacterium]